MERTLAYTETTYKKFEAVAMMLEVQSKHNAKYVVKDVYLDFGLGWKWTTICREGYKECQILSPRQWKMIEAANEPEDFAACVRDIQHGAYFGD